MGKEITVTGCSDCPMHRADGMLGYLCQLENKWLDHNLTEPTTPDWCPLNQGYITIKKA